MAEKIVFTIGHSTHPIGRFIELLKQHGINCIVDVRSSPYSRIAPQFNKEMLSSTLAGYEIVYAHFQKEFGARRTSPSLLDQEHRVDFDKVRSSDEFKQGVERLEKALQLGYRVALMCSEGNPFDCHRFSMIAYQLVREGMEVYHILPDGTVVPNEELEEWLLKKYSRRLPQETLFENVTREMQIDAAYKMRGKDVAFSVQDPSSGCPPYLFHNITGGRVPGSAL